LSNEIDDKFGKNIENFEGDITIFQNIHSILEKHLQVALIYPLKVAKREKIKVTLNEKSIIERALKIMEQSTSDYFLFL